MLLSLLTTFGIVCRTPTFSPNMKLHAIDANLQFQLRRHLPDFTHCTLHHTFLIARQTIWSLEGSRGWSAAYPPHILQRAPSAGAESTHRGETEVPSVGNKAMGLHPSRSVGTELRVWVSWMSATFVATPPTESVIKSVERFGNDKGRTHLKSASWCWMCLVLTFIQPSKFTSICQKVTPRPEWMESS